MYGGAIWYAIDPFDSATLAYHISELNQGLVLSAKTILAFPFAFHSWNGVRHLVCYLMLFV